MIYVTFFCVRNPDTRCFSCRRRLDFFLISHSKQENIELTDIIPSVGSDNSAIKTKLYSLQEGSMGQGYWKLNTCSLLIEDKNFVKSLKTEPLNFRRDTDHFDNVVTRWEFMKYKYRDYSRNHSIYVALFSWLHSVTPNLAGIQELQEAKFCCFPSC